MEAADREQSVVEALTSLADSLTTDADIVDVMDELVQAATTLTSATEAGILLADSDGRLHVVASTGERASAIEEAQLGSDEGPCLEAFHTGVPVEVPNIAESRDRWPTFAEIAATRGFRSAHAVPLQLRGEALGGLNLFSPVSGRLSDRDLALTEAFAQVAIIGIAQQQVVDKHVILTAQLKYALESRVLIEQAKGVIAQRHGITIDAAFLLLRTHARSHRLKLHGLAQSVVLQEVLL
jgi:GAF domain-containing protein